AFEQNQAFVLVPAAVQDPPDDDLGKSAAPSSNCSPIGTQLVLRMTNATMRPVFW
ncbi:hypothetical protein AVEN_236759-1, partial [Araneus ventricosus]